MQSCSARVLQALADYNSVLDEVSASMPRPTSSDVTPSNSETRLRHGMARATAAIAIEQLVAQKPNSLADLSVKQAALESSRAFCAENSWLENLIAESIRRDLSHLAEPRKSSPSWFPYVALPSWSPRPWAKARASRKKSS